MMANFDWKKLIVAGAPTLGAMLDGPMHATAIGALSKVFLGVDDAPQSDVANSILAGVTPEKLAELKQADDYHKSKLAQLNIDLSKLNQSLLLKRHQEYRSRKDDKTFWLGVVILSVFAVTMGMSLYGAYQILAGGITIKDVAAVAAVAGFIGSIIGYIASNAQQVVGYFYGSSAGSSKKTDALSESFSKNSAATPK